MEDTLKRDSVIVVSGAVLLWFLFRNKNSSTVSAVDNSPISIPTFNPADYFTGGSNTNQSSANSLADKYIPLFGFVGGSGSNSANQIPAVTYTPNTYSVPAYVAPPVVPFVAPTLSKLVLPQPVAPQPMQPMVQPAPPIITLTPKPVAAPMVRPVASPIVINYTYKSHQLGGGRTTDSIGSYDVYANGVFKYTGIPPANATNLDVVTNNYVDNSSGGGGA